MYSNKNKQALRKHTPLSANTYAVLAHGKSPKVNQNLIMHSCSNSSKKAAITKPIQTQQI